MAFDPSVLAEVGANLVPDIAGSQAKALTLADLYDQRQLSGIKTQEAKQSQSDMTYARQILAGKDLTKLEDQNSAVAEITKRSPQLGMELMKSFQQGQQAKTQGDMAQLELMNAKNDILGGAIYPLKAKHDELIAKGATEQQVHDALQGDLLNTLQSLSQAKLPNGQPLLSDSDRQFVQQNFARGYNPQAVDIIVQRSAQAKAAITQAFKERDEARKDKAEDRQGKTQAERERHDKAVEEANKVKAKAAAQGFPPEAGDLMAALAERGVSLPAGFRSKAQQLSLLDGLMRRNPDLTADEIADKIKNGQISFGAVKKETQVAAGIAGKVSVAANELEEFIPLAKQASEAVPRGTWVTPNKLMQMGQSEVSDPNLKRLRMYINALLNNYDVLAGRGGTDKDKRAEVRNLLTSAESAEAFQVGLDTFQSEANVAKSAAFKATQAPEATSRSSDVPSTPGATGTTRAPPPGGSGTPGAGSPPPPPPGFVLR